LLSQGNNTLIRLGNSLYTVVDNVNHIVKKVNTAVLSNNSILSTVDTLPSISSVSVGARYILKSDPTTVFSVIATEYGYAYVPSSIQHNNVAEYSLSLWDITHMVSDTFQLLAKSSLASFTHCEMYVAPASDILDALDALRITSSTTLLSIPTLVASVSVLDKKNLESRSKAVVYVASNPINLSKCLFNVSNREVIPELPVTTHSLACNVA